MNTQPNHWKIALIDIHGHDNDCKMYAMMDGEYRFIIGELWEVIHLRNALDAFLKAGGTDETIDNLDDTFSARAIEAQLSAAETQLSNDNERDCATVEDGAQ